MKQDRFARKNEKEQESSRITNDILKIALKLAYGTDKPRKAYLGNLAIKNLWLEVQVPEA